MASDGDLLCLILASSDSHWRPLMSIGHWPHFQQKICNSWHEPIGVRGFWRLVGLFLRFWAVVREPKRGGNVRCSLFLVIFPWFPLMLHMLGPYFPLFSNTLEMLDLVILVRFTYMFPDALYTCSNILPNYPKSIDCNHIHTCTEY